MKDNIVYLLVGQRGSGKSYYSERLIKQQSGLSIVSRDKILIRLFGSIYTNFYTGGVYCAQEIMMRLLRRKLTLQTGLRLILDVWTGESRERKILVRKLRECGATRVVALYFLTPLEVVQVWFWQKPEVARIKEMNDSQRKGRVFFSEDAPERDYLIFHKLASDIDSDGFDEVLKIDPREAPILLNVNLI